MKLEFGCIVPLLSSYSICRIYKSIPLVSTVMQLLEEFREMVVQGKHCLLKECHCEVGFFLILIYLFYFWLCWVFVAACGLSLVAASGGYLTW